jgi:hypothetical protein
MMMMMMITIMFDIVHWLNLDCSQKWQKSRLTKKYENTVTRCVTS